MFDGRFSAGGQEVDIYSGSAYQEATLSPVGVSVNRTMVPPVPAPVFAENRTLEKDFDEVAFGERLTAGELEKVRGGLELLRGTQFGDSQYWLYYKEGVELRWRKTGGIAGSNPPVDMSGRKILWLDTELKQVLETEGAGPGVKAGLAVVMAHEMTHFMDYAKIGSCSTQYCKFMLENNGYLSGIMAYNELRSKGLIPEPNSTFDSLFLQENKFYLDIWNYKHGGPKPDIQSYPLILRLRDADDKKIREPYDQAMEIINKLNRDKNKCSLSEVVNVRCGYKETPGVLGVLFFPADAERYNTLFWAIYAAEQKYCDWRKAIGDPVLQPPPVYTPPQQHPAQNPQQPVQGGNSVSSGSSGGGGNHSGDGGGGQPFIPNPHFQPWQ